VSTSSAPRQCRVSTKDDSSAPQARGPSGDTQRRLGPDRSPARIGRREVSAATPGQRIGREVLLRRHQRSIRRVVPADATQTQVALYQKTAAQYSILTKSE